ncbi:hypothetical protein N7478_004985 [Penicillium angulare]|uniref:uncharacterized protein n=1 Tax=Penicillium angulare TaxID=116970 RepID=UPI0025414A00|nr:uncharacterized protein N7478_004985 [Penicillium angulare]KAJ5279613.1 hypothetical protein N7478_004985 [Penicillium angulare]
MRFYFSVLPVFLLASHVIAGDIDANDVPSECKDVCAPVVSITSSCDKKTSEDDTAELKCICDDPRAAHSLPLCDACMTKYGKDGSDNDANDLVRSCSFTTTSYDSTMAASATSTSVIATDTTGGMSGTMTDSMMSTMTGSMMSTATGDMMSTMTESMTGDMTSTGAMGSGTPAGGSPSAAPTSSSGAMGKTAGLDTGLTGLAIGVLALLGA